MHEIDECDLHAWLDGELDPSREAAVLAWLEAHPDARERLAAYARQALVLRAGLRGDGASAAGPMPKAHLLATRLDRRRRLAGLGRVAAALLLMATGWVAHGLLEGAAGASLPDFAREALQGHESFAERSDPPLEVAARTEEVARFLSEQLGEQVNLPALDRLGLRLVGARLVGTDDGPAGLLLYQDDAGRRLSVSLARDETEAPPILALEQVDGFAVGYWRGKHFAYALVGRADRMRVAEIATRIGARTQ